MSEKITNTAKQMLKKHDLKLYDFLVWFTGGDIQGEVVYTLEDVDNFIFEMTDLNQFARMFGVKEFELAF